MRIAQLQTMITSHQTKGVSRERTGCSYGIRQRDLEEEALHFAGITGTSARHGQCRRARRDDGRSEMSAYGARALVADSRTPDLHSELHETVDRARKRWLGGTWVSSEELIEQSGPYF
jgi:hypothetical protein